jgi:uncharacterized protein
MEIGIPNRISKMCELKLIRSLETIDRSQWNAIAGGNPFLSRDFLSALQDTGCASAQAGWEPLYLTLWRDGDLAAALPLYLKTHSYGEYVFDHAWADAFARNSLSYYPKLICAVPFTPVTGPRLLAANGDDRAILLEGAVQLAKDLEVSSFHVLFPDQESLEVLRQAGFMLREGVQFHWSNHGYGDFEAFLGAMSHDKRKKIRQERRKVREAGVSFRWLQGEDIEDRHLRFFYQCYLHTYRDHWSSPYLNLDFFRSLRERMPEAMLLILAERDSQPVASAFNVIGADVVFGRYWGAMDFVSGLHFETCYCQAIEYCITHRISRFEGGAQGVHKMSRGLLPTPTWSAHWVADRRFAEAIGDFLRQETRGIEHYLEELGAHSPFKGHDR